MKINIGDKGALMRIDNINKKQLSKDSIYRILKSFDIIYSEFTDAEKKRFLSSFVERVEIYEEERGDGRFLKSIRFRFPVYYNGVETQEVDLSDSSWDYQRSLETVCLLSKLHEAKHHINVKLDMDELNLTSAEAKATYKEIEEWVQEHYGFHVTNLNIAQVKQKHGIIERENYNKPKTEGANRPGDDCSAPTGVATETSKQPGCPEEKVKAIEDAMRHFQMID